MSNRLRWSLELGNAKALTKGFCVRLDQGMGLLSEGEVMFRSRLEILEGRGKSKCSCMLSGRSIFTTSDQPVWKRVVSKLLGDACLV